MNQPVIVDYGSMTLSQLRNEMKLRMERYQLRVRLNSDEDRSPTRSSSTNNQASSSSSSSTPVNRMSREDIINTLKDKPALGRHEYGTLRSLHLGLLDYESAPDNKKRKCCLLTPPPPWVQEK